VAVAPVGASAAAGADLRGRGREVVIGDINGDKAQTLAAELGGRRSACSSTQATRDARAHQQGVAKFGRIDFLNNAARCGPGVTGRDSNPSTSSSGVGPHRRR
jgi:hypothetical protein